MMLFYNKDANKTIAKKKSYPIKNDVFIYFFLVIIVLCIYLHEMRRNRFKIIKRTISKSLKYLSNGRSKIRKCV